MQELTFSPTVQLGYILTGIAYFALPAAAFFLMHRHGTAKVYQVIVGVITYFIATRMCDFTVWGLFSSAPMSAKTVIAAELVAFFEEGGRFLAMKYPLTNIKTESAAVCYGIGHAGLECFIRGAQTFKIIGYGQKLNSFGLSSFTEGKSPEQAEAVVGQLSRFAEKSLIVSIFDIISIATNFGVHIALSLLIFSKIQEQKPLKWLGLAILLHYALNAVSAVTSMSGSLLFTKTAVILTGCGIIALIRKLTGVNRYGLFK